MYGSTERIPYSHFLYSFKELKSLPFLFFFFEDGIRKSICKEVFQPSWGAGLGSTLPSSYSSGCLGHAVLPALAFHLAGRYLSLLCPLCNWDVMNAS